MTDKIKLYAKAKAAGIENYRSIPLEELEDMIAKATTDNGGKGKTATAKETVSRAVNKRKTVAKKRTAKKTSATRKKTTTAPARKSTARKSTARPSAAKGKAKRQSVPKRKGSFLKPARIVKTKGKRNFIDMKAIDWKLDSPVGQSGKRSEVLSALRRYKGNYEKCFELLKGNAKRYYPGKSKAKADALLKWLIPRVAYDYVMSTSQHEPGTRVAYGTRSNGNAKTSPKRKTTAAKRTTARKGKTLKRATTRKGAPKRKSAARRK